MITGKCLTIITGLTLALILGCGKSGDRAPDSTASSSTPATTAQDSVAIQQMLTEVITRWRYGDLSALYDNEFEYLQDKYTFDDYLDFQQIQAAEADTVMALNVTKLTFFNRDSAIANVEVVFKGPSGKVSKDYDQYMLYFHRGRWIRPTVGSIDLQKEYEHSRSAADSAAEAEAREASGK